MIITINKIKKNLRDISKRKLGDGGIFFSFKEEKKRAKYNLCIMIVIGHRLPYKIAKI